MSEPIILMVGTPLYQSPDSRYWRLKHKRSVDDSDSQEHSTKKQKTVDSRGVRERCLTNHNLALLIISFADLRETCKWASVSRLHNHWIEDCAHKHWYNLGYQGIIVKYKTDRIKNTMQIYHPLDADASRMVFVCAKCKCKSYSLKHEYTGTCRPCVDRFGACHALDVHLANKHVSGMHGFAMLALL